MRDLTKWFATQSAAALVRYATGLLIGAIIVLLGIDPRAALARFIADPPLWLDHPLVKIIIIVLGLAVIAAVLLMRRSSTSSRAREQDEFAYGLIASGLTLDFDVLPDQRWNIQIGILFKNVAHRVLRYTVEDMAVTLNEQKLLDARFSSREGILHPGQAERFRYDVFREISLPKEAIGNVSAKVSYGPAEGAAIRSLDRAFSFTLRIYAESPSIVWSNTANVDKRI